MIGLAEVENENATFARILSEHRSNTTTNVVVIEMPVNIAFGVFGESTKFVDIL